MRLSAHPESPFYYKLKSTGKTKVFLDGVEQKSVGEFDSDEGWVERCVLTPDGKVQIDPENEDLIWTERVYGNVTYEFCP